MKNCEINKNYIIAIVFVCFCFLDHGNTPLHYAAEGGKAECFNCCLQHDASLPAANNKGDTPLDVAKKYGHRLLMEKACTHNNHYLSVLWLATISV